MNEVRQLREQMNISQAKLAKMLGVNTRTVQNYEALDEVPHKVVMLVRSAISSSSTPITQAPPPAPVPPNYTHISQITDERIRDLEYRVTYLEGQISILLRKEYPEKYDAGGARREDNELSVDGYAI